MQDGHKILINGASGGVGTYVVQIAKSFGAEVTGVCSTRNLEMVRAIGADHVIDYTQTDFTLSGLGYIIQALISSVFIKQQGSTYLSVPKNKDLVVLKELIESGKIKPVIDKTYPLSDTAEAFRYLEEVHAKGKVVITMEHEK